MAARIAMAPRPSNGETLQERSKGKDVRISNIVAAKVRFICMLVIIDICYFIFVFGSQELECLGRGGLLFVELKIALL